MHETPKTGIHNRVQANQWLALGANNFREKIKLKQYVEFDLLKDNHYLGSKKKYLTYLQQFDLHPINFTTEKKCPIQKTSRQKRMQKYRVRKKTSAVLKTPK